MQEFSRIYIDANIFIAIFEPKDQVGLKLRRFLGGVRRHEPAILVTSELTFAETLVDPYRKRNEDLITTYENWSFSNFILEVAPVTKDVLRFAAVLRAENGGLKLPDAIHLSTAFGLECSHFLSADKGFKDEYMLVHHRFGQALGGRTIRCIRPDLDTIDALIAATS